MIKRYWRGYNCLPKWRKPEFWADAIVFSTPEWNYAIQFPKILIRVRSKKRAKERSKVMDIHGLTDCDFCKERNCEDCEGGKDEPKTELQIEGGSE